MKRTSCILLFITLIFSGCYNRDKQVIGRYYIESSDDGLWLNYHGYDNGTLGLVSRIQGVAHTDRFIFVKQKEAEHFDPHEVVSSYYIVPIYDTITFSPEKGVIGPLLLEELKAKCAMLHLPQNIDFEVVK